jgi:hypothetical protein
MVILNLIKYLQHYNTIKILHSKIHKLINSIWNTEELPDQWKKSIIVPVHKKGDKSDSSNYHGI